jgi:hypothetical protein
VQHSGGALRCEDRPLNHETSFFKIVTSFFKGKVVALRALYCKFLPFVRDQFDVFEKVYQSDSKIWFLETGNPLVYAF